MVKSARHVQLVAAILVVSDIALIYFVPIWANRMADHAMTAADLNSSEKLVIGLTDILKNYNLVLVPMLIVLAVVAAILLRHSSNKNKGQDLP